MIAPSTPQDLIIARRSIDMDSMTFRREKEVADTSGRVARYCGLLLLSELREMTMPSASMRKQKCHVT